MIEPGTLLQNRYRVAEQIGKGGMGEVYVATDERFQSTVAIKRTFYDDPEMRRAFEREAKLLNRLRHGALPKVSDHFGEGGGQFLVMEFIEGSDLSEVLKRRKVPFPLADVLRWADELLDALDYLHTQEQPVVHRDIKPPNIKLTPRGRVVLLDFGLAKGLPSQTASGTASSVFGYSLSFAPLEQMQGSGTDARSDLYSLAATLYYLLTCVRPPDALTRASATVKQQPDPLRPAHLLQPQVPAAVGQILHRAMSQNPAKRHASAAELRAALRQAAHDAPQRDVQPQAAAAADVIPHSLSSLVDPTVLDQPAQPPAHRRPRPRAGGPASPSLTTDLSQLNGGEGAPMDSRSWPRSSDTNTVSARVTPRRAGSAAKGTIGLVVCLVAVCLAAGAYLLSRSSGQMTPAAQAEGALPNPESTPQQTATEELSGGSAAPSASDTSPDASRPNGSTQTTQAADNAASRSQTTPGASGASDAVVPDARGAIASPDGASGNAGAEAGGRSGLVIQNPLPATTTTTDEARRTEESRPAQPAYRAEQTDRPPPYQGYPPPPHERRPPPPDGHRPPPHRRPPYR